VLPDALPGESFEGAVYAMEPAVTETGRSLTLRARITNPDGRLKPGMFARVNIVYERRENALQLPRAAILDTDGTQSVYVVADGKAEQRPVKTGLANNGWIEVIEGLGGEERVVVVGQAGLKTGTAVKVVDASAPAGGPAAPAKAK